MAERIFLGLGMSADTDQRAKNEDKSHEIGNSQLINNDFDFSFKSTKQVVILSGK
ncbi:hypothetical protein ACFFJX_19810 [Pseudarcicella hirudinis]|uniref:hypothetical protein n=1 Tax=Pseudarcicella hirudinis TaxID=1079859 RepID=UPI0035E8E58C